MEGQAKLGLFFLVRKRNGFFDIVAKDASIKLAVLWLKFEPRSQIFLTLVATWRLLMCLLL